MSDTPGSADPPRQLGDSPLATESRRILGAAWRAEGFTAPNPTTYPWQWLWDSCFHALVWAALGDERCVVELETALSDQDADGFVPHVRYASGLPPHAAFWSRPTTSSITQPPMYGHAVAELLRRGVEVPGELVDRACRGVRFLVHRRHRTPGGLVVLCHPWESGCDDSARWDDWGAAGRGWFDAKGALLAPIERTDAGAPIANPAFAVGGAGFNALVAFNALELGRATGDDDLTRSGDELADAVASRWDADLLTWVDDGASADGSGRVRTADALLVALVRPRIEALTQLVDAAAHGAAFGPTGTHRAEPSYAPRAYWRGGTWPQIAYLLWLASTRSRAADVAGSLSRSIQAGAWRSGFAEYWEPDTGEGLGAVPQSWATLALLVA